MDRETYQTTVRWLIGIIVLASVSVVSFTTGQQWGARETLNDVEAYGFKAAYKRFHGWDYRTQEEVRQFNLQLEKAKHGVSK